MLFLSQKPGHDGSIALITDGRLEFSLEAEKDSFPRYSQTTPSLTVEALSLMDEVPDVLCLSGWVKGFHSIERPLGAGYFGWQESTIQTGSTRVLGRRVRTFSSTHERSHLLCAYGMSPFEQGRPCYALVWEGNIGSFYEIDENVRITRIAHVLEDPGNKYSFLFALADPTFPSEPGRFRFENAGKLMSLTAYGERGPVAPEEQKLIDDILNRRSIILTTPKSEFTGSPYHDIGVESQAFKNVAAKFSDAVFEIFLTAAREMLRKGYPLLISGGCGLNCDWNSRWRTSGLFPEVFAPPCPNDSGSAIGTAIDAQLHYTGHAKLDWDVYAGTEFVIDAEVPASFHVYDLDYADVARLLADGGVVAWVQGRYELGPRALGNRSILAAPFDRATLHRLNRIKEREQYRPIAPVCLEEDVGKHFDWSGESPYMLYFQQVRSEQLAAVTHVDNSARLQTVRTDQNARLTRLLEAFRRSTGYGVLCNTSLNFRGRGFINRMSDLVEYALDRELDGFVVGDRLFRRRRG